MNSEEIVNIPKMKGEYLMKKILISALLLVMALSSAPLVSKAEIKKDCSYAGVQCKAIEIFRGDTGHYASSAIFVPKGTIITYGVNNSYSDGQFQVGITLWNTSLTKQVASQIVPYGRNDQFSYLVTEPGNYLVILHSGDSSQGRSHAYGWLRSTIY